MQCSVTYPVFRSDCCFAYLKDSEGTEVELFIRFDAPCSCYNEKLLEKISDLKPPLTLDLANASVDFRGFGIYKTDISFDKDETTKMSSHITSPLFQIVKRLFADTRENIEVLTNTCYVCEKEIQDANHVRYKNNQCAHEKCVKADETAVRGILRKEANKYKFVFTFDYDTFGQTEEGKYSLWLAEGGGAAWMVPLV